MIDPASLVARSAAWPAGEPFDGVLHVFVAFDWGGEVDLAHAQRLCAAPRHELSRRRRTPASIRYQPAPALASLGLVELDLPELGRTTIDCEALLFDFGAVSVSCRAPFALSPERLVWLAGGLSESRGIVQSLAAAARPLFDRLRPAIAQPHWSDHSEEYFVVQLRPGPSLPPPEKLLADHAAWLAALVRLEPAPLSAQEVAEALRLTIEYGPNDLFAADWSAAVLVDDDCDETLQTIEFANLQLLEFRHIDSLLDQRVADAYRRLSALNRRWLPFWRTYARSLRTLGELRIDAHDVFERTGNALKLVGDQYLARLYRLLAARFHIDAWERSIERSLAVIEGAYRVVSDQAATYRAELLEWIIIALIAFEIAMTLWGLE